MKMKRCFIFQIYAQVLFVSGQWVFPDQQQNTFHQTLPYVQQRRYDQELPVWSQQYSPINPTPVIDSKRISKQKCEEYAKLTYSEFLVGGLAAGRRKAHRYQNYNCDSLSGLVVGGTKAKSTDFPHMAAIGYKDLNGDLSFKCGGSLISERFVLSAAHCKKPGASLVRLGTLDLSSTSQAQDFTIEKFINHEDYDSLTKFNDIALLKLSRDVTFGSTIRPACLWQTTKIDKTKVVASGWGATENAGTASSVLMKVTLDIISNQVCALNYEDNYEITQNQVCSGVLTGGKDTCEGDSGGPIQITKDDNPCLCYIVGVTSYGSYCGAKNSPAIYTRVSSYINWIEDKVWN